MSAEGEGRGSFENESSRAKGAKAAERGGWKRERERGKVVRKTETWSSCVTSVGARRDIPVSSDLCARHHGGEERRRWQAMEQAIYEKEAKNEDEVNDIHGGYRILPARSHLRLPCLLLSLLRPPPPLLLIRSRVVLCPARSNTFPFRKHLRASFDPHERTTYTCVYITRSTALDVFRYILLGYRFLRVKHVFDNVLSPIFALDVSLLINPESRVKGSRLSRLDKGVARVPILYVGCTDLSTV